MNRSLFCGHPSYFSLAKTDNLLDLDLVTIYPFDECFFPAQSPKLVSILVTGSYTVAVVYLCRSIAFPDCGKSDSTPPHVRMLLQTGSIHRNVRRNRHSV